MAIYSNSVIRRAEQILGYGISSTAGTRTFPVVDGVVYADLFTGDATIEDFTGTITKTFNGRRNALTYWNELRVVSCHLKEVTVTATWGSADFMTDIDGLLAWLDENPSTENFDEAGVASKKIEDFSVSFRTAEEKQLDLNTILHEGFGYYIRRPFIIDVAKEQRHGYRYF